MRHLIALLLICFATLTQAAVTPYNVEIQQANASGTGYMGIRIDPPAASASAILYYDGANNTPKYLKLGAFTVASDTLIAPAASTPSASGATRTFNSAFQVSSTQGVRVHYSCKIVTTATILAGQEGEIILEQADDSGFTTNVVTLDIMGNGQTYSVAVAIQGVQSLTSNLGADYVPAGKYLRLRTNNITGTPAYTFRNGREVLE